MADALCVEDINVAGHLEHGVFSISGDGDRATLVETPAVEDSVNLTSRGVRS